MLKRIGIIFTVMLIGLFFVLPISANRTDVVLDQQVTLGVPGNFELVDSNQDQKPEALKVRVKVNSYREGNFIATGKLEAQEGEAWVEVGVTVQPFQWSTTNDTLEFTFQSDLIREHKLSGPYRASVSLREGDWELPLQVVGFSPNYSWERFASDSQVSPGEAVSDLAQAKRVAEIWARLKSFKLGKLLRVEYNYDRWNLDYQNKKNSGILRVMISPQGGIETMNIKETVPFDPEK